MSADLVFLAVDIANILCVLLLAAQVISAGRARAAVWLPVLLCVCAIAHFVLGRADYGYWISPAYRLEVGAWHPALNLLRNLSPGLVMILVHRLFVDRGRAPTWVLVAFGVQIFLEEPVRWLAPAVRDWPWLIDWAPTLLQTLFAGLALYWTLADWRGDLIESRRRWRLLVTVALLVNVVASSLLLRVAIPQDSVANYHTHLVLMAFNLCLTLLLVFVFSRPGVDGYLDPIRSKAPPPRPVGGIDGLARVNALMAVEHLYREPGLSLRQLADRARLPEYRLRRLVHEALGYRNFNAYLHAYRVREACGLLADPAQARTPILTIALDVGYQSLNTFNRGFRETIGTTPSEYRANPTAHQIPQSDPKNFRDSAISEIGEP